MIIAYICRFTEKEVDKQINIEGERDCVGSGTCRQVAFFFPPAAFYVRRLKVP